jgi:hypothetical protein
MGCLLLLVGHTFYFLLEVVGRTFRMFFGPTVFRLHVRVKGFRVLGFRILGFWVLGFRFFGFWVLGFGFWVFGLSTQA